MLSTALGPLLLARLEDPGVTEVMLNPDVRVWIDRIDVGPIEPGLTCRRSHAADIRHGGAALHDEYRPRACGARVAYGATNPEAGGR